MGSYISHTNLIELCRSNVARNSQCVQQVLRHEMVHAIQENLQLKTAVIPEPLLSWMVRGLLSDSEIDDSAALRQARYGSGIRGSGAVAAAELVDWQCALG